MKPKTEIYFERPSKTISGVSELKIKPDLETEKNKSFES